MSCRIVFKKQERDLFILLRLVYYADEIRKKASNKMDFVLPHKGRR